MYKIAICDDEEFYRDKLRNYLLNNEKLKGQIEIYEYRDGKDLVDDIDRYHDLIFLDIQMEKLKGEEAAKIIRNNNKNAVLVFCTNYGKLTPETIKVQPFRYVMKDIRDNILKEELPGIIDEMLRRKNPDIMTIVGDGYLYQVEVKNILYISVKKRGTQIYVYERNQMDILNCKDSLSDLYLAAKDKGFEYAHNSYIVNMANIIKLSKNVITLKDGTELNISRSKKQIFDDSFTEFLHMRYKRR